jgi:hypothetical protein
MRLRRLLTILVLALAAFAAGKQTALDRFIQTPDFRAISMAVILEPAIWLGITVTA